MIGMKFREFAVHSAIIMLITGAIFYHNAVLASICTAGERCVRVIVPSLYMMSVLMGILSGCGTLTWIAAPFRRRYPDAEVFLILLLSQIGGYPIGVQLLHRLQKDGRISRQHEAALSGSCFGCGPAFLLGVFRGNCRIQLIVWIAAILPNLLLGSIYLHQNRGILLESNNTLNRTPQYFQNAVENAASSMLKICSMILIFAAFLTTVECGIYDMFSCRFPSWLYSFLEISNVTEYLRQGGTLPAAAAMLSFGGVCVFLQNTVICEGNTAWKFFLICRAAAAAASFFFCQAAMAVWGGGSVMTELVHSANCTMQEPNPVPGICLLLMSVLVLLKYEKTPLILRKRTKKY